MMGGGGGGGGWGAGLMQLMQGLADVGTAYQTGKFNKHEAHLQRRFIRRMYNNRYLHTMRDMRRAGLNPILAGEVGGGTVGTPGMASMATPSVNTSRAYNEARMTKAQVNNIDANTGKQEADRLASISQDVLNTANAGLARQSVEESIARQELIKQQAINAGASARQIEETIRKTKAEIDAITAEQPGRVYRNQPWYLQTQGVGNVINTAKGALDVITGR